MTQVDRVDTTDQLVKQAVAVATATRPTVTVPDKDRISIGHRGRAEEHVAVAGGTRVDLVSVIWAEADGERLASEILPYGEDDPEALHAAVDQVLAVARLRLAEATSRRAQGKAWLLNKIANDASTYGHGGNSHLRELPCLVAEAQRLRYATEDELRELLLEALPEVAGNRSGWQDRVVDGWLSQARDAQSRQIEQAMVDAYSERVRPLLASVKQVAAADAALTEVLARRDAAIKAAHEAKSSVTALVDITGLARQRIYQILDEKN